MVALNWQTPDENMWLNHARFSVNGGCGYLLKPTYLREARQQVFDPLAQNISERSTPVQMRVVVLETRNVPMHENKPSSSIFVNVRKASFAMPDC